MSFGTRLIFAREQKKITQKKLSELLEITPTRLNYWEKDKREPDVEMIKKIARTLDTTGDFLLGLENYLNSKNNFKENKLISSFNKLNNIGQEKAIERVDELTQIEKYTIDNVSEELCVTRLDIKGIQLYEIPANTGNGMIITGDVPYEIKQIDLTIAPQARKADFALYVRGDSMEPSYYDGDIIFIKSQPAVDNGQIGIFIYDDESYIKKYSVQEDGAYLVSLNNKYEPIKIDENLNFKVCGLVL
ncbi:MAG: helix-turn-helix domain-containing protein [Clostridiales bacterium]|nr:helix-turn-helix domain-containing protein [Clostridiales bacterium]